MVERVTGIRRRGAVQRTEIWQRQHHGPSQAIEWDGEFHVIGAGKSDSVEYEVASDALFVYSENSGLGYCAIELHSKGEGDEVSGTIFDRSHDRDEESVTAFGPVEEYFFENDEYDDVAERSPEDLWQEYLGKATAPAETPSPSAPPTPQEPQASRAPIRRLVLDAFGGPHLDSGAGPDGVIQKITEDPDEEERTSLGVPKVHDIRGWRCDGCRRSFRARSCDCLEMCPACGCRQIRADQGGYPEGSNDEASHTEKVYRKFFEDDMHDPEGTMIGDQPV